MKALCSRLGFVLVVVAGAVLWSQPGERSNGVALAQEAYGSPVGEFDGPIGGPMAYGEPVGSAPIGGPMVYGPDVGSAPIGGPMLYGEPVGNGPIGGPAAYGAPVGLGGDGAPIGGDTLY